MTELQAALIDGQSVTTIGAAVPVLERALHYGDGLFETIACLEGRPRLLAAHLRRLTAGCERLGLDSPAPGTLAEEVRRLAHGTARGIVKVLVTRGTALARGYGATGGEQTRRILLRYTWPQEDPAAQAEGVRVRLATLRLGENPALAGIKHCNRLEQVLARREWTDPGIAEALLFSSSRALVSGTTSNVFLVTGSKLLTPALDRCGVAGVMRAQILDIAASSGMVALERRIEAADLEAAEEVFLTNALTGIRPVRELNGIPRVPGPVTRRLQASLAEHLAAERSFAAGGQHPWQ